jgi:hypothetical protein
MLHLYQKEPIRSRTGTTRDIIALGCLSPDGPSVITMGGEFFLANRTNAQKYIEECQSIFLLMIEKKFDVKSGDEFILSLAMHRLNIPIRSAHAYVNRYYTLMYRQIPERWRYHPVSVLHVPGEKKYGMLALYKRYISKGKIPNNNQVYRILHISHPSLKTRIHRVYTAIAVTLGIKKRQWID